MLLRNETTGEIVEAFIWPVKDEASRFRFAVKMQGEVHEIRDLIDWQLAEGWDCERKALKMEGCRV